MKAIVADQLMVEQQGVRVLDNLSFELEAGQVVGLIGPSGSGKTTLLRAMVGTQRFKGGLELLGFRAGSKQLRTQIGYMAQSLSLYLDLTVRENVWYFGQMLGIDHQQIEDMIEKVELTQLARRLVGQLSGGQKARVSLAIALLGQPMILILDEPTVGLDPLLRQRLWQQFKDLAQQGATLVISSHVMDEAARCDQLLLLRDGRLLAGMTPTELRQRTGQSELESAFIQLIGERSNE